MKVKRLNPTADTKRTLFLLSMNQCAFPSCLHNIINENNQFIGEICHIEAANEGGERFNMKQTNEERRHISNLILMCPIHHKTTNNTNIYNVEKMIEIKLKHEKKSFTVNEITNLSETYINNELDKVIYYPSNLENLSLTEDERTETFFLTAKLLMTKIYNLPRKIRNFYANALLYADIGDLDISFNPTKLKGIIDIDNTEIENNVSILHKSNLMWDDYDEENLCFWFTTPNKSDDDQIWLLQLIRNRFVAEPTTLIDIFTNLNFIHLEILKKKHNKNEETNNLP
jgi:hypothetical protein